MAHPPHHTVLPAPKHDAALVCLGFLRSSSFHLSLDFPSGRQPTQFLQLAPNPRRHLQFRGYQQADTLPQWLPLGCCHPPRALLSRETPFPKSSPHQAFLTQLWAVYGPQPSQLLQQSWCRTTEMLSLMAISSGTGPRECCSAARAALLLLVLPEKSSWEHLRHLWL